MGSKAIKIISENLEKEITKRGLNNQEVSEAIGHGRNYISEALRRGRIGKGAVRALEILYQIHPRDYAVPEPWQASAGVVKEEKKEDIIDYDRLRHAVYHAVYHAVRKAWREK